MADGPQKLPKWQATANVVPNCPQQISCQTKSFFRAIFFICNSSFQMYNTDIKSKKERVKYVERLLWCGGSLAGYLSPLWRAL
jgi:hypothetical protein